MTKVSLSYLQKIIVTEYPQFFESHSGSSAFKDIMSIGDRSFAPQYIVRQFNASLRFTEALLNPKISSFLSKSLYFQAGPIECIAYQVGDLARYIVCTTVYNVPTCYINLEDCYFATGSYECEVFGYQVDLRLVYDKLFAISSSCVDNNGQENDEKHIALLIGITSNLGHYAWNHICGLAAFCNSSFLGNSETQGFKIILGQYDYFDIVNHPSLRDIQGLELVSIDFAQEDEKKEPAIITNDILVRPSAYFLSSRLQRLTVDFLKPILCEEMCKIFNQIPETAIPICVSLRISGSRRWVNYKEVIKKVLAFNKNIVVFIDGMLFHDRQTIKDSAALSLELFHIQQFVKSLESDCARVHCISGLHLAAKINIYRRCTLLIQPIGSENIIPGWIYGLNILVFGPESIRRLASLQQWTALSIRDNVKILSSRHVTSTFNGYIVKSDEIINALETHIRERSLSRGTKAGLDADQATTIYATLSLQDAINDCTRAYLPRGNSVTVLMPCKGFSPYLSESINSIKKQTHGDINLVVLDASETPMACEIVDIFRRYDSRIDYIHYPPESHPAERIDSFVSIYAETCEYFAFQHADDISYSNRIHSQYSFMNDNPAIDLVSAAYRSFIHDRGSSPRSNDKDHVHIKPLVHNEISSQLIFWWVMHVPTLFFRSGILREKGYHFNSGYRLIGDYAANLFLRNRVTMANLPEELSAYRIHYSNDGYINKPSLLAEHRRLVRELLVSIGAPSSDRAVDMHMAIRLLPDGMVHLETQRDYKQLWDWLYALNRLNQKNHFAPREEFSTLVDSLAAMAGEASMHLLRENISRSSGRKYPLNLRAAVAQLHRSGPSLRVASSF